jgi:hypothetical protein
MNNQDFYSKTITREEYEQNLVEILEDFYKIYDAYFDIFFNNVVNGEFKKGGYLSKI